MLDKFNTLDSLTIRIALKIEKLERYKEQGVATTFLNRWGLFFGIHNKKSSDIINQMLLNHRISELRWILDCLPTPDLWEKVKEFVEDYKKGQE